MDNVPVEVWHPRNPKHGDYTTNIALKLAKITGGDPMEIAQELVRQFEENRETHTATP